MNIDDIKGKKITIMGLGLHGGAIGTIRFLSEAGARLTVTDIKSKEELVASVEKLKDVKGIKYIFHQHRPEDFTSADIVIKNPAVPWTNKYIKLALDKKIPVEMDSSLFFKFCKNTIIGVTGTKGKTTTATLIFEILKSAGQVPLKVGIGQTSVLDKLRSLKKESIVVFELSSWRLSALGRSRVSPDIAVITNLYPDHLNYYKKMAEYVKDKKNIYLYQNKANVCVLSDDNDRVKELSPEIKARLIRFSKKKIASGAGVYMEKGAIYSNDGIDEKSILDVAEIKLKGEHNLENVLAAVACAVAQGIDRASIRKAVMSFNGVAHRLEIVREMNKIVYINDSAATTPEAAVSGIQSFSEPVVLIAGGSDKNLAMDELAKAIREKVKGVIFLKGAATDKIIMAMKKADVASAPSTYKIAETMEQAVNAARLLAESGDVILLSPGAASFGMFQNEFDRGDKFKEAVKNLK